MSHHRCRNFIPFHSIQMASISYIYIDKLNFIIIPFNSINKSKKKNLFPLSLFLFVFFY